MNNIDKIKKSIAVLKGMASTKEKNVNKIIMFDMLRVLDNNIDKMIALSKLEDKLFQAIGWSYADCCATLDEGNDPRQTDMADVIERFKKDLEV